jgi:hypothetical protein
MTHAEIVKVLEKLIGPIEPVGDSTIDHDRLKNLIALASTTLTLIEAIKRVERDKGHHLASVAEAGKVAYKSLQEIKEYIEGDD